jgi:LmbE family N-acetylglucosaminyl deacetylase
MRILGLARSGEQLSVLCLGAHADDIEIGAGATILGWIERGIRLEVHWAVLSATGHRREEAHASAKAFLADTARSTIDIATFKDGFFPYHGAELKAWFEMLKERVDPQIVLCHRRGDAHQDHREVSQLTWNTFHDYLNSGRRCRAEGRERLLQTKLSAASAVDLVPVVDPWAATGQGDRCRGQN